MADFLDAVEMFWTFLERLTRRELIVGDKFTPIMFHNDADFINRFQLSKDVVLNILIDIDDDLNNGIQRNSSVSPLNRLTLR